MPKPNQVRIFLIFFLIFLAGCGPSKSALMNQKFDAPLHQKVTALENQKRSEVLAVFGKCTSAIDESMRQHLASVVEELQSVIGDIFTARVSSEKIFKLAKLEFVTQLQLSQESKPLSN